MLQLAHAVSSIPPARAIHRVQFDTFARRSHFAGAAVAVRAVEAMHGARHGLRSRVLAWLLLPQGWLGVVECARLHDLAGDMDRLRHAMAGALSPGEADAEPVWAAETEICRIADDVALAEAVRTILVEPVRLGLAHRRGDYPFWGAVWSQPERATVARATRVPA
jgi:hypothetical protein